MSSISEFKGLNLIITKNPNASSYQTVEKYLEEQAEIGSIVEITDEEKKKAIETNTLWDCQFYPRTPIGFFARSFATCEALEAWIAEYNADPLKFEVG